MNFELDELFWLLLSFRLGRWTERNVPIGLGNENELDFDLSSTFISEVKFAVIFSVAISLRSTWGVCGSGTDFAKQ